MTLSPARRAAYDVVRRVREREAYGPQTLDAVLGAAKLSAEDSALATRLAYGTLQSLGTLDEAIDRLVAKPSALEPQVRDALRLAAYEILFARTPPRAAVHQGVESVRRVRPQAAGMANAVLRRLAEEADTFPWGDPDTDTAALARLTGHPLWLVERIVADHGAAAARLALEADDEPAPLYLWHNPFRGHLQEALTALAEDGADPRACEPSGCVEACVPSAAVRGRALATGLVLVADAAAQLAARALGAHPGRVVVDVASGRGTKTAQLQALAVAAGPPARIFALDVHPFKADLLGKRMEELGVPDVVALSGDATTLEHVPGLPSHGTADAVLIDAPCSGTGTLRRHPEKRWRVTPGQVTELAGIQARMLGASARLVRPGGVVVYSTCSVLREENADVLEAFLGGEGGSGFRVRPLSDVVPDAWHSWLTPDGCFQSLPARGGPDGHFVAALVRDGGS